jgi:hypothetical protein
VGDLQNRMCSDIAVTSKVEILDIIRGGHSCAIRAFE